MRRDKTGTDMVNETGSNTKADYGHTGLFQNLKPLLDLWSKPGPGYNDHIHVFLSICDMKFVHCSTKSTIVNTV